ncbi:MAG: pantetheine-phosphate adenylyltransferase [Elusimicrobia bacterium RIFOXYB2_FULL_48_7]|nr:MAG: pantetheine-phosphate adenylyltransferase [Elusimicrobia bacterium RIFOXYB2_FULL_48_7]
MKIAVYPGSFDPPTNGHTEIIYRSSKIFDKLIIAVTRNFSKKSTFSVEERKEMLEKCTDSLRNVEVDSFSGLLVDYAQKKKASVIIRGLRAVSDFEYEVQLALMNRRMSKKIETIFFIPDENYTFLSSSLVKEIAELGGKINELVPAVIANKVMSKYRK